ncbi:hypothetical protein NECID01_0406 [Nematocida sp. AWRm77]|nr:hypothetical protein NECID01_0406 [Nematocida sp. AWRm77]
MKVQLAIISFSVALVSAVDSDFVMDRTPPRFPAPVAAATNPYIPVGIKQETSLDDQKKKIVVNRKSTVPFLSGLTALLKESVSLGLRAVADTFRIFLVSSKAYLDDDDAYERTQPIYFSAPSQINTRPSSIHPNFSSSTPRYADKEEFSAEDSQDPDPSRSLKSMFRKKFSDLHANIQYPSKFVKNGIKNAKKYLLSSARLAKAFSSTAMDKALSLYDNTTRSAALLEQLVKRGVITPRSATRELMRTIKDTGHKYLKMGADSVQGAANNLLSIAPGTPESVMSGLETTPDASGSLGMNIPNSPPSRNARVNKAARSLTEKARQKDEMIYDWLHPKKAPKLGEFWVPAKKAVEKVKRQWKILGASSFPEMEKYSEVFASATDELARILDVLSVRLGKTVEFEVPGLNVLKDRFQEVVEEIKKKNTLAISGSFSLPRLLRYSMGIIDTLKDIDRGILQLVPFVETTHAVEVRPFGMIHARAKKEARDLFGLPQIPPYEDLNCLANGCRSNPVYS